MAKVIDKIVIDSKEPKNTNVLWLNSQNPKNIKLMAFGAKGWSEVPGSLSDILNSLATKQNITDNNLQTTSKSIVGAINEINAIRGSGITSIAFDDDTNVYAMIVPYNSKIKVIIAKNLESLTINGVSVFVDNNLDSKIVTIDELSFLQGNLLTMEFSRINSGNAFISIEFERI